MEDDSEEEREEERKWVARVLQFGRYTTAKLLARGGMGAAFRVTARDQSARALKLALPMASGEGDVFLKEARASQGGEIHHETVIIHYFSLLILHSSINEPNNVSSCVFS